MSDARTNPVSEAALRIPLGWGLAGFGVFSLLGNAMGGWLRYPELGAAVLFPPYAALTTALIFSSRRDWIWYILVGAGAHALSFWPQFNPSWILGADIANITRALVATVLLQRCFAGPPRLDDMRALGLFIGIAVIVAPAIAAAIGAANVVLHRAPTTYWRAWSGWFLSNALTGLTVLPMLLAAVASAPGWRRRIERARAVEVLLVAAGIGATSGFAFLVPASGRPDLMLRFLAPLPVLIWSALRFGSGGAGFALTAVAYAAIVGADRRTGPFLAASPDESVLTLQLFLLLTTIQILSIAAIASGRRRAVELYSALLTSLHEQVAVIDARGVVLAVNESWRRFADRPRGRSFGGLNVGDNYLAMVRASAQDGVASAERALPGLEQVLERESRRFDMEYQYLFDGDNEWFALSAQALERPDGGAVVTRADVTARHSAQMEIESQRNELSHLARVAVLGQLSGALAHELRQPLASILSNAEAAQHLLRRRTVDLRELDAILVDIVSEDQRASEVMARLRALLSRGETRLQPVSVDELVDEVLSLANAELITRHVSASVVVEPPVAAVLGNRVQLQQVLLNLILNACEAMATTTPTERRLSLTARATPVNDVLLSIRDTGAGIPDELRDRLFEPFVTSKPEGLGLGLSISRTIVAAHGGRLWAENNHERGATIHLLLPAAQIASAQDLAGASLLEAPVLAPIAG